jgi:hypothetical protein
MELVFFGLLGLVAGHLLAKWKNNLPFYGIKNNFDYYKHRIFKHTHAQFPDNCKVCDLQTILEPITKND